MTGDDFCNFFVNWIPLPRLRKAIYRSLGMDIHPTAHIMRNGHFVALRNIHVAERSIIGHDCLLDAKGSIFIGSDVNISSYVKIITAKHRIDGAGFEGDGKPVTIGNRVWIASAALILHGAEIGEGAVVAAGAVGTPPSGGLLVFADVDDAVIEEYATADPYVTAGLVTAWRIDPWTVVAAR